MITKMSIACDICACDPNDERELYKADALSIKLRSCWAFDVAAGCSLNIAAIVSANISAGLSERVFSFSKAFE